MVVTGTAPTSLATAAGVVGAGLITGSGVTTGSIIGSGVITDSVITGGTTGEVITGGVTPAEPTIMLPCSSRISVGLIPGPKPKSSKGGGTKGGLNS